MFGKNSDVDHDEDSDGENDDDESHCQRHRFVDERHIFALDALALLLADV